VNYVIDSSALLAVLQKETGYLTVIPLLNGSLMSTVNLSEVLQKVEQKNLQIVNLMSNLQTMGIEMIPFTTEQATLTATLWARYSSLGLSLADRACLALAQSRNAIAVTADRNWADVSNIQVQIIR
jgi:PIN domain nuclease of toxin-antitoxin system